MTWDGEGFRIMLDRLAQVRRSMDGAKNTKLMTKWADYGDYRKYQIGDILDHLTSETKELADAIECGEGLSEIRDEIIDVANVLEMVWDVLGFAKA